MIRAASGRASLGNVQQLEREIRHQTVRGKEIDAAFGDGTEVVGGFLGGERVDYMATVIPTKDERTDDYGGHREKFLPGRRESS